MCNIIVYPCTKYLYFVSFLVSDGTVTGTRYKSSISWGYVFGSALSGGYVIATGFCPPSSMLIFNIAASSLSIKNFNVGTLYGLGIEPTSGR